MKDSRSKSVTSSKAERRHEALEPRAPHPSVAGLRGLAKRAVDIAVSAAGLLLLSPLLALIAVAVKWSDGGPALYRQIRVGLKGRPFTIVKFRTMRVEAEEGLGPIWSLSHDPRCFPFGAWLRRRGLDELPQLWNVLRGEMSLVGPRPERPEFVGEFSSTFSGYDRRHEVRGGITGYAQIHGWRGATSLEKRLLHDVYYVGHWSLWLDLRILLLTLIRGWSERTLEGVMGDGPPAV